MKKLSLNLRIKLRIIVEILTLAILVFTCVALYPSAATDRPIAPVNDLITAAYCSQKDCTAENKSGISEEFSGLLRRFNQLIDEIKDSTRFKDSLSSDGVVNKSRLVVFYFLILATIITCLLIYFLKKPTSSINYVALQLVALALVVITVATFGFMGTLEGRELTAIFGSISGYVFGRTIPANPG